MTEASGRPALRQRWRTIAQHTLLVLGGVLAGLVLLEVALQTAAAVQRARETPPSFAWRGTGRRVLAVGDSNTYGLYVGGERAYPAVFERRWNASRRGPAVEVMNLGRPGMNSSLAKALVDDLLADLKPDFLFLMIGVNDFWVPAGADAPLWRRARVVKLFTMLRVRLGDPTAWPPFEPERIAVEGRTHEIAFAGSPTFVWEWRNVLVGNLRAIIRRARLAGVRVVLLTYPADDGAYGSTNGAIRRLASALAVPLVDVGLAVRRRCSSASTPDPSCADGDCVAPTDCGLVLPDGHPSVAGHEAAADTLIPAYRLLLEVELRGERARETRRQTHGSRPAR